MQDATASSQRPVVSPLVSATMIEKIIVVAPTTAVPISTGLAVALNVLPAPSFSSSRSLARSKSTSKPKFCFSCSLMPGIVLDHRQLEDRLRVVGHRPYESTAIVTGPMPRKPNATRPNANTAGASISAPRPQRADAVGDAHQRDDAQAEPVGAEVAGDEAGQDVQRRAALTRRGHDLPARAPTRST